MVAEKIEAVQGASIMFAFSAFWIVGSDRLLYWLVPETFQSTGQGIKGLFYVALASGLVYLLLYRYQRQQSTLVEQRNSLLETEELRTSALLTFSVYHDIRNIATAFSLNLEFLKNHNFVAEGEGRDVLEEVAQLTRRLVGLADKLRVPDHDSSEHFFPEQVIAGCVNLMKQSMLLHVDVNMAVIGDIPMLTGKKAWLEQMLSNLILNADQAVENGEPIDVEVATEIDAVVIKVSDHGTGIPENDISKIWKPLYTTKKNGTGLGMLVVSESIRAFRGTVAVTSTLGRGTCFTIRLPFK